MIFMTRFFRSSLYICRFDSVARIFSKTFLLFLALTGFFVVSCEEDPTTIGKGLLPGSDFVKIESIDTIKALSFTMYDDSIRSENPGISYLGEIWDPYFGTTTASFITQLRLKEDWDGKPYVLDSMKLILEFSNVKGGAAGTHTLSFYEIDKFLTTDTAYYSTDSVPLASFKMEGIPLPALKADTINNIEIKLPDVSFGISLLTDTSKLFHSNNTPDFRSYFKGLQFRINSTADPVLVSLSLSNSNSGYLLIDRYYKNFFVLYYHDADGNSKTSYFIMDAINRNASFNKFRHNFSTAEAGKKIEHYNDLSVRDTLTYIQSLNGVYTRILLPGLEDLKNSPDLGNIAVNKARLTVPFYVDDEIYTDSKVPRQLYIRYRTQSGNKPIVPDYNIDTYHSFFDGIADTINHVYNFNLATFVQAYLEDTSGEIKPELEIIQGSGIGNMILKGNASKTPVKFDVAYTRF